MPRPKPTPEELESARAKLTADPNIARIAKAVNMPTEEYLELVMSFIANPNKQPTVKIMSDDQIRQAGEEPPNLKKIAAVVQEYADAIAITNKSKFADPNSQREKVSGPGAIPVPPAATAEPEEVRDDLKVEVERERTTGKLKKIR